MTTRKCFYSFHFTPDSSRAGQVRNMGVVEGNKPASDNDWEDVKAGGDKAIKKWIDDQLYGRSCTVVLIGAKTAKREWIDYEITESWNRGKGVLGIYVHNLKDFNSTQANKGANPFAHIDVGEKKMSSIVKAKDPIYTTSTKVYDYIKENISDWIEEAITIRDKH